MGEGKGRRGVKTLRERVVYGTAVKRSWKRFLNTLIEWLAQSRHSWWLPVGLCNRCERSFRAFADRLPVVQPTPARCGESIERELSCAIQTIGFRHCAPQRLAGEEIIEWEIRRTTRVLFKNKLPFLLYSFRAGDFNSGEFWRVIVCTMHGIRREARDLTKKELRKRRLIHRGSIVYGTICNIVNCKVCTQGRTAPMLRPGLKWKVAPFSLKKSEQNFNFCTLVRPPLWCARGKPTQLLPPSFWAALCVRYFITAFMSTTVCHHLFLIYFIWNLCIQQLRLKAFLSQNNWSNDMKGRNGTYVVQVILLHPTFEKYYLLVYYYIGIPENPKQIQSVKVNWRHQKKDDSTNPPRVLTTVTSVLV